METMDAVVKRNASSERFMQHLKHFSMDLLAI